MLPRSLLALVLLTGAVPAVAAEPSTLVISSPDLAVEVGGVRFEPGHRYRIEFSYQNGRAGQYSWITGADTAERATPLPARHETTRFTQEFTVDGDDTWVGPRKHDAETPAQADLVLDEFTVIDLGRTG